MVEEANTSPISAKKKTDTFDKIEKSQTSKKPSLPPRKNKSDTLNSIDKSRYTPRTNLSNKSTRIKKPTQIEILKDNKYVSDFLDKEMI